jgi:DNA-directed RNA polymerase beta subunit
MHHEDDGTMIYMYPNDARLRNLTYWTNIYLDIKQTREAAVPDENVRLGLLNRQRIAR